MTLTATDILIIGAYFVITILIGLYFTKMASRNIDSYFLGGKRMPWYILSVSNASGMFDVSGTMWLVSILFIYGLKGIWFPWLWPFFNQIFMMIFLSVWLRRSNVITGAEWISTRFGNTTGARLSHLIVVVFALVSVLGFLGYAFVGIGKFAQIFLPWDISANNYALILMIFTGLYVVSGGFISVVATDVIQYILMTIASIAIGIIAIQAVSPEMISAVTPEGWDSAFFGSKLDLNWTGILDSAQDRINQDGYTLFGAFVMMMLFKGFFISAAGPIPSHDMQRILSNKTPKNAALMSGLNSVVVLIPRFMMVAGLVVLALVFFSDELSARGDQVDFELILPYALANFIPPGLKGLVIAGLFAAFMSTISSFINVAPAYLINDIYKKYINPNASDKKYVRLSYLASVLVLSMGIGLGYIIETVDSITQWIVTALWAGYSAPNMLKWYWWRFNGYGFFWGMLAGLLTALIIPFILPGMVPIYHFPFIFIASLLASVIASLVSKPEDDHVLMKFYKQVRPWGFWNPVYEKVKAGDAGFIKNTHFKRDMFNVAVGIIWQLFLIALPVYLVIQDYFSLPVIIGVIILCSVILKKNWYDKLEEN
ncbi:MAG: sodium:solute symporter family protein [Mariniphaga sp.]